MAGVMMRVAPAASTTHGSDSATLRTTPAESVRILLLAWMKPWQMS